MTDTPIETMRTLLSSAVEQTADSEVKFKLRTALQLLVLIEEQEKEAQQALAEADLPDDVRENLRDLGYL